MQLGLYRKILEWFPVVGISLFTGLYIYSSTLYPGGSQADLTSVGFNWIHNYWCDLTNEYSMNEKLNPASPIAITAMIILCLSLMMFFIQFGRNFSTSRFWKVVIQVFGTISMTFAILVFTRLHATMIALSSLFGLFVLIGILIEVAKSRYTFLKLGGLLCIFLLALNNYIYYSRYFVDILPLLQKITFAIVLIWIMGLNYNMIRTGGRKS